MELITTPLEGGYVIKPTVFPDPSGYFFESFNEQRFNRKTGLNIHFVQDNQSMSSYGVLRGLDFQTGVHAQAKPVRVLKGKVLDVAVDLRSGSATYGQHYSVQKVTDSLRGHSHSKGIIRKRKAGYKQLATDNFPGLAVCITDLFAGKVDK